MKILLDKITYRKYRQGIKSPLRRLNFPKKIYKIMYLTTHKLQT